MAGGTKTRRLKKKNNINVALCLNKNNNKKLLICKVNKNWKEIKEDINESIGTSCLLISSKSRKNSIK
jgi:hypothetical protein